MLIIFSCNLRNREKKEKKSDKMIGSNFTEVIEMTGTFFLPESSFDAGPQWIAILIGVIFSKSVVHFIWKLSIQRRVHWTHAENVRSKENSTSINYQGSNKYFWWGWTDRVITGDTQPFSPPPSREIEIHVSCIL